MLRQSDDTVYKIEMSEVNNEEEIDSENDGYSEVDNEDAYGDEAESDHEENSEDNSHVEDEVDYENEGVEETECVHSMDEDSEDERYTIERIYDIFQVNNHQLRTLIVFLEEDYVDIHCFDVTYVYLRFEKFENKCKVSRRYEGSSSEIHNNNYFDLAITVLTKLAMMMNDNLTKIVCFYDLKNAEKTFLFEKMFLPMKETYCNKVAEEWKSHDYDEHPLGRMIRQSNVNDYEIEMSEMNNGVEYDLESYGYSDVDDENGYENELDEEARNNDSVKDEVEDDENDEEEDDEEDADIVDEDEEEAEVAGI